MKKRLFQVLDEMNVNDGTNKTATCACCFDMVSANTAKGGAHVTMGIPTEALHKIMHDEYKPMLVLLDMKEYHRLDATPASDELQTALARAERAEKALEQIRDWKLPSTGRFWDAEETQPMSYEACYGSNGVRDYFRNLANQTLHDNKQPEALTPKTGEDDRQTIH